MNIPYTITALRTIAGLTQTQIGIEIGLSQSSVCDMEAGRAGVKRPTYCVVAGLTRLAQKHGIATQAPESSG